MNTNRLRLALLGLLLTSTYHLDATAQRRGRPTYYRCLSGRSLQVETFQGGDLHLKRSKKPGLVYEGTMGYPMVKVVVPRVGKRRARADRAPEQTITVQPGQRIAVSARGYWPSLGEKGARRGRADHDAVLGLDKLRYISATNPSGAGKSRLHVLEVPTDAKPGTTISLSVGDRTQPKQPRLEYTGKGPSGMKYRRYRIQVLPPEPR
jgi:hypothetical protein